MRHDGLPDSRFSHGMVASEAQTRGFVECCRSPRQIRRKEGGGPQDYGFRLYCTSITLHTCANSHSSLGAFWSLGGTLLGRAIFSTLQPRSCILGPAHILKS